MTIRLKFVMVFLVDLDITMYQDYIKGSVKWETESICREEVEVENRS